eukprot:Nk52_evm1s426 gene=Nk52_evmTU1s426
MMDPSTIAGWNALGDFVEGQGGLREDGVEMSPFEAAHDGLGYFEYLAGDARNAEYLAEFLNGMTFMDMGGILNLFDWSRCIGKRALEIGGSHGGLLQVVKREHPGVSCLNFDRKEVIEQAEEIPGVKMCAGDMFESSTYPRGENGEEVDFVLLKRVFNCWTDSQCIKLLKSIKEATSSSNAKLLVYERVLKKAGDSSSRTDFESRKGDVVMMMIGGRMRTLEELKHLLRCGGWGVGSISYDSGDTIHGLVLLECVQVKDSETG